jgi:hypothetical protein
MSPSGSSLVGSGRGAITATLLMTKLNDIA